VPVELPPVFRWFFEKQSSVSRDTDPVTRGSAANAPCAVSHHAGFTFADARPESRNPIRGPHKTGKEARFPAV